ncbi:MULTISPECIES: 5-oxoprolinase subunit B family protein [unclassified Streptomyces]|uniref:5-oxoprolinase subunit B family protein n=1 Tax=unclassified Streptomyces TaxID=2593676 RepID=UPI000B84331C|nr:MULTISPECIES: allophanate hydrolase subunit 1 [unclassified Streptomyces]MYS19531.1 carboxyltransferase domain-containing protein [Streptomyces sp. SID4948]
MRPAVRVLPAGARAVLLETADGAQAQALHAELLRRRAAGELSDVTEIVPAARTVLVGGLTDPRGFALDVVRWDVPPVEAGRGEALELPVRFDGPDLAEVAERWGVGPREAVGLVVRTAFRVAFCGFAPGFGYLTGLPAHLQLPRRASPRTAVPAGSVALAGPYAGVYPRSSPGGWQLIGTTGARLWDPDRDPAALLAPGTEVRFTEEAG